MAGPRFTGSLVALITPFKADNPGELDEAALRSLVDYHVKNGTDGLVPCGTTGESVTLEESEHDRAIRIVVEQAAGRVPVIAGVGTNSTAKTIKFSKMAKAAGADATLVVTPYYNKPTQQGLFLHYEAIAKATDLPIVVYNVPTRTSVNLLPETLARLAKIEPIIAVKEASGSLDQVTQIVELCGPDFAVLSGDDSLTLPLLAVGGVGVISVTGNIAPSATAEMVRAFRAGDTARARELHHALFPLTKLLFVETNPIPVKTAAGILGLCSPALRLPMCPMADANRAKLEAELRACELVQRL